MKRKKLLTELMCLCLVGGAFTGCGSTADNSAAQLTSEQTEDGAKDSAEDSTEDITDVVLDDADVEADTDTDIVEDTTPRIFSYLDYAEEEGESLILTIYVQAFNVVFSDTLDGSQISFAEDLEHAEDIQVTSLNADKSIAELTVTIPKNDLDVENLALSATLTVAAGALVDGEQTKIAEDITDDGYYVMAEANKAVLGSTTADTTISENGLKLIEKYTSCQLRAYQASNGAWYIGYGHSSQKGATITKEKAEEYLESDLQQYAARVRKYDSIYHWNQNQFDALVCFAYAVGSIETLTEKGTRTIEEISDNFLNYVKANGKVLPGLVRRRGDEKALFDTPVE